MPYSPAHTTGGLSLDGLTSRLPSGTTRAVARIQQATVVQSTIIQATAHVGRQALFAVADLSEVEGQLSQICPRSAERLEIIANIATMTIAQRVSEFRG